MGVAARSAAIALAAVLGAASPALASGTGGSPALGATGGTSPVASKTPASVAPTATAGQPVTQIFGSPRPAQLLGGVARAASGTPRRVRRALRAGNLLQRYPYRYGGGHASFVDSAYDCSGAVSLVLHAAGWLVSPLDSTSLERFGAPGPGRWVTVYANAAHAFVYVAGLRLDTAGGVPGPRWQTAPRSLSGFVARHPPGF